MQVVAPELPAVSVTGTELSNEGPISLLAFWVAIEVVCRAGAPLASESPLSLLTFWVAIELLLTATKRGLETIIERRYRAKKANATLKRNSWALRAVEAWGVLAVPRAAL